MKSNTLLVSGTIILLLVTSLFIIFSFLKSSDFSITSYAVEQTATSNVSISKFLSISLSANLSNGIVFETVNTVPATNVNATYNYEGNDTTMFVNVSTDSNVNVDFCIKANDNLIDAVGANVITLANEKYINASINNLSLPGPPTSSVALTTSYVKASDANGPGNVTYYRLWLDVPAATPAASYNNTISFKGIETTTAC